MHHASPLPCFSERCAPSRSSLHCLFSMKLYHQGQVYTTTLQWKLCANKESLSYHISAKMCAIKDKFTPIKMLHRKMCTRKTYDTEDASEEDQYQQRHVYATTTSARMLLWKMTTRKEEMYILTFSNQRYIPPGTCLHY